MSERRPFEGIAKTLYDEEWIVRDAAAWTLGLIDDPGTVPALTAALKDKVEEVRIGAVMPLVCTKDPAAVAAFVVEYPEVLEMDPRGQVHERLSTPDRGAGIRNMASDGIQCGIPTLTKM